MCDWPNIIDIVKRMETTFHPVDEFKLGDFTCYVTKNKYGAWLGYVDVTDFPEIQSDDYDFYNRILPFHRGCTYCKWTMSLGSKKFDKEHFIIGCDWNHGGNRGMRNAITSSTSFEDLVGVEHATEDEVKDNLREVVEMIPEFRLKMTIRGNGV